MTIPAKRQGVCVKCGGPCDKYGKKMICKNCWKAEPKEKSLITCIECKATVKHYGKGLCRKCYMVAWNASERGKEIHRQSERNRRANNPEVVRQQDRNRNRSEGRKTWRRTYQKQYYEQNKDKLQAYNRKWMNSHRELMSHHAQQYRHRAANLPRTLTLAEWREILNEYNYCCAYCGKPGHRFAREHKIPASRGGGYTRENIVPACQSCNSQKHNKTPEEFAVYLERKRRILSGG